MLFTPFFTICVLFLVCYSILNASCKKLFAQLRYDLIDHLAVSLALQLWHNSLHDLSFVSRSDQVCMFLCKVSLDLRSVHQLWSVFRNHIISCLIFIFQILSGFRTGVDLLFHRFQLFQDNTVNQFATDIVTSAFVDCHLLHCGNQ